MRLTWTCSLRRVEGLAEEVLESSGRRGVNARGIREGSRV